MKEFVEKLREKADVFEKSGCSVDGIVKDYRKSADMIEGLCEKSNISGFVEKLIERLEEKRRWVAYGNWDRDIGMTHKVVPFGDIKEIVNKLAEEFASDINVRSKNKEVQCEEKMPEEKSKFSNEKLDAIMDKILDTTQEEPQPNFYTERFNRVI